MAELDDAIYGRIKARCAAGYAAAEGGDTAGALREFQAALEEVPPPKEAWEATTWILGGMGEALFRGRAHEAAKDVFQRALQCPGGVGNPLLHLRLGQCLFELNIGQEAADELARAYMDGGEEIFEAEDPKYLDWLRSMMGTLES